MRGGKSLADRGAIPRLLSSIYRRARKIEKDSGGETQAEVSMSYYEIYNDRVYDLFEPPEKRTLAGLPIRDNQHGKTVVVGLTERPCTTLKEFEHSYDQANLNRSTSATKLNAHSSRSHAILCVKVTQTTADEVRVSTASAIDLAGSEDNRRTDNNKDRLVESASINKSLFVLASCVEAISKKHSRIPYRESKMTRILALGQNNGFTVMILNLAPVRSYHLDTLSSLNFANRTKKIEVNEIENLPFLREPLGKTKSEGPTAGTLNAPPMHRQPLRPKILSQNSSLKEVAGNMPKPVKQFAVYTDKTKTTQRPFQSANTGQSRSSVVVTKSPKRTSSEAMHPLSRPSKFSRLYEPNMSKDAIEALIERKVSEALAGKIDQTTIPVQEPLNEEVQRRLNELEKRVEGQETERAEGLQYLLMAKQHQARGEDSSALKMYQLALPHFPGNEKLARKIEALKNKTVAEKIDQHTSSAEQFDPEPAQSVAARRNVTVDNDDSYHEGEDRTDTYEEDDSFVYRPRTKIRRPHLTNLSRTTGALDLHSTSPDHSLSIHDEPRSEGYFTSSLASQTPRTKHLLEIINSKDISQIKLLKGVGAKKAEAIVNCLCELDDDVQMTSLGQLGKLKGVGIRTVETMRLGL